MKEKPIDRIREIMVYNNLQTAAFEQKIGISNATISKALKKRTNVRDETLKKVLDAFPEVSPDWLRYGIGHMFSYGGPISDPENVLEPEGANIYTLQRHYIYKLEETLARLKGTLGMAPTRKPALNARQRPA